MCMATGKSLPMFPQMVFGSVLLPSGTSSVDAELDGLRVVEVVHRHLQLLVLRDAQSWRSAHATKIVSGSSSGLAGSTSTTLSGPNPVATLTNLVCS